MGEEGRGGLNVGMMKRRCAGRWERGWFKRGARSVCELLGGGGGGKDCMRKVGEGGMGCG